MKNTSNRQVTDVFFIVYLLKNTTSMIRANTIIVSTTMPNKSRYIISSKTVSIIAPPPFLRVSTLYMYGGKPHLLIFISYTVYYIIFFTKRQVFVVILLI